MKRKSYTVEFKITAIRLNDIEKSKSKVSKKLNIDRKILKDWIENRAVFESCMTKLTR